MNVIRNNYLENDHLALASDLETIKGLGLNIIPLSRVVNWQQGMVEAEEVSNSVAITFDDGSWFDYYDLEHPTCGMQRSMFNILCDFSTREEPARQVHASSFVISSPRARSSLDKSCMIGKDWWGDQWWFEAVASGILDVECHSWDHLHPALERVAQVDQMKGDFIHVDNFADCEIQFRKAGRYIGNILAGNPPTLFAYPYGTASEYAVKDYLPGNEPIHGFRAAFTTEPRPVSRTDNVWLLPRFVFGRDWTSPSGLEDILNNV